MTSYRSFTQQRNNWTTSTTAWIKFTGLDPPCCFGSLWQKFNKVLETRLRCLVHIDMLASHIRDVNLLSHRIPKALYSIEIWWLWRSLEYSELIVMFWKLVELCVLLEAAIRLWVHCSHKGMTTWPFSSDLSHQQSIFTQRTDTRWMLFLFQSFSVNPRNG